MIPKERNATPQSTTSEDSTPLVKRRRIEVPTKAEPDGNMHLSTPPSQDSNANNVPALNKAELHAHDQATPSEAVCLTDMEDPDQAFSLDMFQIPQRIITIECGDDLSAHFHVPLTIVCEQSQKQVEIFYQADELRRRYAKVKDLRKRVEALYPLLDLHGIRTTHKPRETAIALIMEASNSFPDPTYQAGVAQRLAEATDTVFRKNDLWLKPPSKKFDKQQYPKRDIATRLNHLQDIAVHTVLERLSMCLREFKGIEKRKASKIPVKAAAQQRIILQSSDPQTVEVVIEWLYKSTISFTSVTHLCAIHALAEKLGITRLATECMVILSTATSRLLQQAKASGITLKGLLDVCTRGDSSHPDLDVNDDVLSSPRVIGEVFKIALQTPDPPVVLQELVADAIAENEDNKLLEQLLPLMNLEMRGKVMLRSLQAMRQQDRSQAYAGIEGNSASRIEEAGYDNERDVQAEEQCGSKRGRGSEVEMVVGGNGQQEG